MEGVRVSASPFVLANPDVKAAIEQRLSGYKHSLRYTMAESEGQLTDSLYRREIDLAVLNTPADGDFRSVPITNTGVTIVVDRANPLASHASCEMANLSGRVFCLPCIDRFPELSRSLWVLFAGRVDNVAVVNYHEDIRGMETNALCGACCPTPFLNSSGETTSIPVEDAKPLVLHLAWRAGGSIGSLLV